MVQATFPLPRAGSQRREAGGRGRAPDERVGDAFQPNDEVIAVRPRAEFHGVDEIDRRPIADARFLVRRDIGGNERPERRSELHAARKFVRRGLGRIRIEVTIGAAASVENVFAVGNIRRVVG